MRRWRLNLQWLAARPDGLPPCPLCGAPQGPAPAGYGITKPGTSLDGAPVCDACAMKYTPELLPARAAANEAARVAWETGRRDAERIRKGSPMTTGERLDLLERVEESLPHRGVALVDNCPDDPELWDETIVENLRDNEADPDALCDMAYVTPEDTVAMNYGEEFAIHTAPRPGYCGPDAERHARAVAQIVHQELTIAGVSHTYGGGKTVLVSASSEAVVGDILGL